jgi:hypothetical protein
MPYKALWLVQIALLLASWHYQHAGTIIFARNLKREVGIIWGFGMHLMTAIGGPDILSLAR